MSLAQIIGYARAGALDFAWRKFNEEQARDETSDPATLNLKGRLLKDMAARAGAAERPSLWSDAAAAYEAAAAATPSSYSLINAATLRFLAGEPRSATALAARTVAMVENSPDEPETPYWRAATRAEALLLLDREPEARAAFADAVALAPRAWEDHASTLRQFGLILAAQGRDSGWLDAHRPPRSLHFGGHMSFDPEVSRREQLDDRIRAVLDEEDIGFGYGALAAGADILIAEALIERGAELHAVLPGGAEAFAAVSVDPFGKAWRRRFDSALARAETVRAVRPLGAPPDRPMIDLGDEVAMGAAAMNARRLESRALQLLVIPDPPSAADRSGRDGGTPWRRRILAAPREAPPSANGASLPAAPHERLALLALSLPPGAARETLPALAARLKAIGGLAVPPYFTGREVVLACSGPAEAARIAAALAGPAGAATAGIGGHYGIAEAVEDPFSGARRVGGEAAELALAAAASAPPGSVCVTGDFAAALAANGDGAVQAELVGELDPSGGGAPEPLYALALGL